MKKIIFVLAILTIFSCTPDPEIIDQSPSQVSAVDLASAIEVNRIYSRVFKDESNQLVEGLFFEFNILDPKADIPKEMYFQGNVLLDDGLGFDKLAGDGIYSQFEPIKLSPNDTRLNQKRIFFDKNVRESPNASFLSCSFDLSRVGQKCFGQVCPKTSLLGGTTWFCVCTKDCKFCLGSDC